MVTPAVRIHTSSRASQQYSMVTIHKARAQSPAVQEKKKNRKEKEPSYWKKQASYGTMEEGREVGESGMSRLPPPPSQQHCPMATQQSLPPRSLPASGNELQANRCSTLRGGLRLRRNKKVPPCGNIEHGHGRSQKGPEAAVAEPGAHPHAEGTEELARSQWPWALSQSRNTCVSGKPREPAPTPKTGC